MLAGLNDVSGGGIILAVPFPRPRDRHALLEDAEYYRCRERLITFLEDPVHKNALHVSESHGAPSPASPLLAQTLQPMPERGSYLKPETVSA